MREARALVRRLLEKKPVDGSQVNAAELIASELVSNAVSHGSRPGDRIEFEVKLTRRTLLLRVVDSARAGGELQAPRPDRDRETGRGLVIVGRLARLSERFADGRRDVRAELDL